MDRKLVAKQLREEAQQMVKAADMLDGTSTGKRRGRPLGYKVAAATQEKAGKKRMGRPPGKKGGKAKKPADTE